MTADPLGAADPSAGTGLADTVADPYRWLEAPADPDTVVWTAHEERRYEQARAAWANRAEHLRRIRAWNRIGLLSAPIARPGRLFLTRSTPDSEQPVLVVRSTESAGAERVLVDPLAIDPTGLTVLDAWQPSWSGDRLACQLSVAGTEDSRFWVLDVATGRVVDGPIDRMRRSSVAWLPGDRQLVYVRRLPPGPAPGEERYHRRVWVHEVGADPAGDVMIFGDGGEKTRFYAVTAAQGGHRLVLTATTGASPARDVWLAEAGDGAAPPVFRPVQSGVDARTWVTVSGRPDGRPDGREKLYLRTEVGAERGRVMTVDVADVVGRPDRSSCPVTDSAPAWRELIPADPEAVLTDLAVLDGPDLPVPVLVVAAARHAVAEIAVHDLATGSRLGAVPLPGHGAVGPLLTDPDDGHRVWFRYADHTTSPVILRYDARTGELERWLVPADSARAPEVAVHRSIFRSADGTPVRMFVLSPRGGREESPDRPRPAILTGYGGFGQSMDPGYMVHALAWVAAGGVFAVAGLRGGGEEGAAWHRAGMREHKQRVFDDFDAAARCLIDGGWTTPASLGILGSSNGGLLVGAALTQHPERYGAAVAVSPLLDMLRYERSGLGPSWREEYGSADDPAMAGHLQAYSPYHRVRPGTPYPATMLAVFDGDTRVDPGHARKMVAALQEAIEPSRPVLLRVERGTGHGSRSESRMEELLADVLAFFDHELRSAGQRDRELGQPPVQ